MKGKNKMLSEYKVQRQVSHWIETTVKAHSLENALEMADAEFADGEGVEAENSYEMNEDRFWIETHDGLVFTDTHAPAELKHYLPHGATTLNN
jgi:hypothetical protein